MEEQDSEVSLQLYINMYIYTVNYYSASRGQQ